jgi:formamidopyrimidine-DNA glycosylase
MPELPEVETIRRDLLPRVVGRTIVAAWVSPDAHRLVQWPSPVDLCRGLAGGRIEDVRRRGKYLLFPLSDGRCWIVHLRMTGALLLRRDGCGDERYLRARFHLDDGSALCYVDLRKLGMMWLADDPAAVVGKLGPEPLGEGFGPEQLRALLAGRRAPLKSVLMDQGSIAGIGNIYADEALFLARLHPRRLAKDVSAAAARRLHGAIRQALLEAMGNRGSSFRDYVDIEGDMGGHQLHVRVFRRTDEPCLECGTPIRRIKVGGRSTHFCPKCQR